MVDKSARRVLLRRARVWSLIAALLFATLDTARATSGCTTSANVVTCTADNGTIFSYDAPIQGPVSVTVNQNGSTGTLELSPPGGSNSYTGGTTVYAGSLRIGGTDAMIGSPTGPLKLQGGTLLPIANVTMSTRPIVLTGAGGTVQLGQQGYWQVIVPGVISGPGGLTVTGGGLLILNSGANTYSGGTVITNEATLGVGGDADLGASSLTFLEGRLLAASPLTLSRNIVLLPSSRTVAGAYILPNGFAVTLSGVISGAGALTLLPNGSNGPGGIVTLTGANTYTGPTFIYATELVVGNSAALGQTVSLTLGQGGSLKAGTSFTYPGFVLTSGGPGTIDTGGFSITLSGGLIQGPFTVVGGGTLILTEATLTGSVPVTGQGVILNGATLLVGTDSSEILNGPVTVSAGTLRGLGVITGNLTLNGDTVAPGAGTLVPGSSIGTLTVNGNYTQASAGTLSIEVDPRSASKLSVGGSASLAGTLNLSFDKGRYTTRSYVLLQAGTVLGQFENVTGRPAFLSTTITYTPTEVDLTVSAVEHGRFSDPNVATTLNQQSLGALLDRAYPNSAGDMATVFDTLVTLPAQQLQNAYTLMSGGIYAASPAVATGAARHVEAAVFAHLGAVENASPAGNATRASMRRLADTAGGLSLAGGALNALARVLDPAPAPATAGDGVWATAFGWRTDPTSGSGDASGRVTGFLGGYDRHLRSNLTAGMMAGNWNTSLSMTDGSGQTLSTASTLVGLYGTYASGPLVVRATAGYTWDANQGTRPVTIGGLSRLATSAYSGNEILAALEIGRVITWGDIDVTPFAGAAYTHVAQGGYMEQGAGALNLTVSPQATDSLRALFGLEIGGESSAGDDTRLVWKAYGEYSRETLTVNPQIVAQLVGAGSAGTFTVLGAAPAQDEVGAGVNLMLTSRDHWAVYVAYDVQWNSNQTNQAVSGGIRFRF